MWNLKHSLVGQFKNTHVQEVTLIVILGLVAFTIYSDQGCLLVGPVSLGVPVSYRESEQFVVESFFPWQLGRTMWPVKFSIPI